MKIFPFKQLCCNLLVQKILTIYDSYLNTAFSFLLENMINTRVHFYIGRNYNNNFLCLFKHFFKIPRHGCCGDKPRAFILYRGKKTMKQRHGISSHIHIFKKYYPHGERMANCSCMFCLRGTAACSRCGKVHTKRGRYPENGIGPVVWAVRGGHAPAAFSRSSHC